MAKKSNNLVTVAFRYPDREMPLLVGAAVQAGEPLSVFLRRFVSTSLRTSLEGKAAKRRHARNRKQAIAR